MRREDASSEGGAAVKKVAQVELPRARCSDALEHLCSLAGAAWMRSTIDAPAHRVIPRRVGPGCLGWVPNSISVSHPLQALAGRIPDCSCRFSSERLQL